MKALTIIVLLIFVAFSSFAQFGCDPNSSMENPALEKSVNNFEFDCMQYAVNVATNVNHNRMVGIMDANGRNTSTPLLELKPNSKGNTSIWNVQLTEHENWDYASGGVISVYRRPGVLVNEGKTIRMNLYTLEIDSSLYMPDLVESLQKVRKEYGKYEELVVTVEKYYENGTLYAQMKGVVNIPDKGMRPSKLGGIISYFYTILGYNFIFKIKDDERKAKLELSSKSLDYWNKSAFNAVMKSGDFYKAVEGIPEGRYNWSVQSGRLAFQVENYGEYVFVSIPVKNTTKENREKVMTRLTAWLDKNKHNGIESATVKLFGETPWLEMKINIAGLTGKQIYGDVYEKIMLKWGESFVEEGEKATRK